MNGLRSMRARRANDIHPGIGTAFFVLGNLGNEGGDNFDEGKKAGVLSLK